MTTVSAPSALRSLRVDDLPDLSTRQQLSDVTQLSIPTLARWSMSGIGPKVTRIGRAVRYRREDVVSWLDSLSA